MAWRRRTLLRRCTLAIAHREQIAQEAEDQRQDTAQRQARQQSEQQQLPVPSDPVRGYTRRLACSGAADTFQHLTYAQVGAICGAVDDVSVTRDATRFPGWQLSLKCDVA